MIVKHLRRSGQAMVEFALVLPILILLLLCLVDFGLLAYAHVQVANAAREGARAGSLYLGSRFKYTSCTGSPVPCPTGYGNPSNPDCWSLSEWVENSLVERNRSNSGCPTGGFNTAVSSFGLLNPVRCASAASANCWDYRISGSAVAGEQIEVEVEYRYNLLFVGDLVVFPTNPVIITKTTAMMVQNN